jgi:FkbM family methyltransferase
MWSFFEFLNDDSVLTVLDVGAALTDSPIYQRMVDAKRARLIGFEPDADACKRLNEKFGQPHRFFPLFAGDGRPAIFHQTNWGASGSLFEPNTALQNKFRCLGDVTVPIAKHSISTTRLDDIDEITDVDFVKIDVQGSELAVFQNATRVLADAVLIQTEVCFVELYKQQPMFSDVDAFLRSQGYQFHDMLAGVRAFKPMLNARSSAPYFLRAFRQMLWADAYYVKDWMHLDRLPAVKLKHMAALLHDVLGSYDLAYLALQEMDKKSGTDVATRYLTRLEDEGVCVGDADDGAPLPLSALMTGEKPELPTPVAPFKTKTVEWSPIVLKTAEGISITVPASLKCISTYILLEQEQWFEKEVGYVRRWLKSGMNVIDIGANVGVFSLPIARRVGPAGNVFAFEPGGSNRRHLDSSRLENGLDNLRVSACALSDSEKAGWLEIKSSGELNSLIEGSPASSEDAERVRVSTLDVQALEGTWPSIDFVKIDAEGQEARIVAGGREFFRQQSPLVMYEVNNVGSQNNGLRWIFEALGYTTYRLLGDASCLVPFGSDESLDKYEVNLFAAKPDRAAGIASDGLLVTELTGFSLTDEEKNKALASLLDLPYARSFEFSPQDVRQCPYGNGLIAYAAYRFVELSPARRYAALCAAFETLHAYCEATPTSTATASLVRVALDLGHRLLVVDALTALLHVTDEPINQPFFPPCQRYEGLPCEGREADWFSAAAIEQLEISQEYSSLFAKKGLDRLQGLCLSPFASAEISRRAILRSARAGMALRDVSGYLNPAHQHQNPFYWSPTGLSEIFALL